MINQHIKDEIIDNIVAKLHLYGKNRNVDFDNLQIFIHISDGKNYSNILWQSKEKQSQVAQARSVQTVK